MRVFLKLLVISISFLTGFSAKAQIKHVILVSIDGLHPDMYLDKSWPTPNLRYLMKIGTYADHMLSVFPAYTYPSHTAMVTGALPARSGITYNQPISDMSGNWYWFNKAIKVPTLWQVLKQCGMTTASVEWPPSVTNEITWDVPEIWSNENPEDRITEARKYATPGLIDEVEKYATGILDSNTMREDYLSMDEQTGRIAAYIFKTRKPNFMAVHFACVDGKEHDDGRDADSVRLAVAVNDHAIGDILESVQRSNMTDSTVVIIVGDHGFSTIHTVMRPNMLIKNVKARFIPAGGSCFLYRLLGTSSKDELCIIKAVTDSLNKLPNFQRKQFRIINRKELNEMGADSSAILALTAVSGTVFSGAENASQTVNNGPGTLIQQNELEGVFIPTHGGHHGYDPNTPDMWTGFIAAGVGINKGGHVKELHVTDIAPLIAKLLGIDFATQDGRLVPGILKE
jgi:predicted AlkP superfamily pyrophosphatase or phosphodiesterase